MHAIIVQKQEKEKTFDLNLQWSHRMVIGISYIRRISLLRLLCLLVVKPCGRVDFNLISVSEVWLKWAQITLSCVFSTKELSQDVGQGFQRHYGMSASNRHIPNRCKDLINFITIHRIPCYLHCLDQLDLILKLYSKICVYYASYSQPEVKTWLC